MGFTTVLYQIIFTILLFEFSFVIIAFMDTNSFSLYSKMHCARCVKADGRVSSLSSSSIHLPLLILRQAAQ